MQVIAYTRPHLLIKLHLLEVIKHVAYISLMTSEGNNDCFVVAFNRSFTSGASHT